MAIYIKIEIHISQFLRSGPPSLFMHFPIRNAIELVLFDNVLHVYGGLHYCRIDVVVASIRFGFHMTFVTECIPLTITNAFYPTFFAWKS